MKLKLTLFLAFFAFVFAGTAQESQTVGANYVGVSSQKRVVPSLASRTNLEAAVPRTTAPNDGRSAKVEVIPGKDPQTADDYLGRNPHATKGSIPARDLLNDFVVGNSVGSPSDPALAVGPNNVFIVYNTGFMIYDKDGNIQQGPTNPNAIFSGGGCCDLTVSYDNLADRWVVTYLFVGAGMEIAVSNGPDPLTTTWNVYTLPQVNDYNKLSVWRDGYYITDNGANDVWAVDRTAALAGAATVGIQGFNIPGVQGQNFTSAQVFNITNDNHPTTGGAPLVYMRDDGFAGVTVDAVNIWTVNVDFVTPGNSNVPAPEEFTVSPFIGVFDGGSFSNLPQPGGGPIDALQSTIMNQAQFRKFATHNSAIFNFVVDVDATAGKLAAVRWYEFRQAVDGGVWTMFQEGTYTAPEGKHAWNASMAMDEQGNIGMGYSVMAGPTTPNPTDHRVGAAYTGRFSTDAIGVMTIAEDVYGIGTGNIAGNRFGDYAKIDVDPSDNQTFWFITEYRNTNHVAEFKIAPDADNDTGIIAISQPSDGLLTATETVEVTVRNFGTLPQSNVPVQFTVDGGTPVVEIVPGPIAPASSVIYTFNPGTADLSTQGVTYIIEACTVLVGDEVPTNDCFSKDVTHLNNSDVGVTGLVAPVSGSGLSATEDVTITIENFGGDVQTNIPVFFTVDGGTPVQETYMGSIAAGASDTFTFITAQADLSALGDYVFVAGTELVGDADTSNDDFTATISNFICQPMSGCEDFNDGVTELQLADQDISTDCSASGYTDNTDIVFNFVLNDNPFDGILQTGFQNSVYAIWIDFNDNNDFEPSELIVTGISGGTANTDTPFTVDFSAIAATAPGMHLMRVRGGDEINGTGTVTDPCGDLQYGRTNDFTANVSGELLNVNDLPFAEAELIITTLPNNQFDLSFNTTTYTDKLPVYIYNVLGQTLAFYTLENQGNGYAKTLDMSYVSSGVYFVKIGNDKLNKVKRIIVK